MNKFKIWLESEGESGMGTQTPDMFPNRGNAASGSDAVIQSGEQPQVDGQQNKIEPDQDKMSAIDSNLAHFKNQLPEKGSEKIEKFLKLFKQLEEKWEKIKIKDRPQPQMGLGNVQNQGYADQMQQFPNMMPMGQGSDFNSGPGIFGQH